MIKSNSLSSYITVANHYRRSIRIDSDIGRYDSLGGYVCNGTAKSVLESMARQVRSSSQRAFTWTGPFGGGKSSLAVILASALHEDSKLRELARARLPLGLTSALDEAFPVSKGWKVVAVSGRRASVISEIASAINKATNQQLLSPRKASGQDVVEALESIAKSDEVDGVLLIVDEMGKFLESSALGGDDVHFFQDLAEHAARCAEPFVIVGILHQAFRQYAARLGAEAKDDWSKVQGRYVDIPLVASSDEVVELIGKALSCDAVHDWTLPHSEVVAEAIRKRRPSVGKGFGKSLDACWPLHPTMAALLGPISRRQFGQNERSTFGFLSSVEPSGFTAFLEAAPVDSKVWYRPSDYWDFLRANLEPAILSSTDGHRWAQAVDAVERVESRGDDLRTSLIKNIAVVDLFRNGSGLSADADVLNTLFGDVESVDLDRALTDLVSWRAAIFKKHTGSWSTFEGSDFDIDHAVSDVRAKGVGLNLTVLSDMARLRPVVAKRHYQATGTLRWMDVVISDGRDVEKQARKASETGGFGKFVLYLPARHETPEKTKRHIKKLSEEAPRNVIFGYASNYGVIVELGEELICLQHIAEANHQLVGDSVARRELAARLASVRSALEDEMREAIDGATWLISGAWGKASKLSSMASDLADEIYHSAPLIFSELVNRDSLSSNAVKARRDLIHRMISSESEENLGLSGWPAERGLHETILLRTGLHSQTQQGNWRLTDPDCVDLSNFSPLWKAADDLFAVSEKIIQASGVYDVWRAPPFGVRDGCYPILFTAYFLARKDTVALYKDGMFLPKVTDADMDELLQDRSRFSLRQISVDEEKVEVLEGIANILRRAGSSEFSGDALSVARGLVGLVYGLPDWVRKTRTLSVEAISVRDILLRANDPHKVIFVDLPAVLDATSFADYLQALEGPILELSDAYVKLLRTIEHKMLHELDASSGLEELRHRASVVDGVTGDFRLNAFCARLVKHQGEIETLESILSLAANKPPRLWVDGDIDSSLFEISSWATKFRQAETLAAIKGRAPTREAFAVVVGAGRSAKSLVRAFDLADRDVDVVDQVAQKVLHQLRSDDLSDELLLAVLAKVGLALVGEEV